LSFVLCHCFSSAEEGLNVDSMPSNSPGQSPGHKMMTKDE